MNYSAAPLAESESEFEVAELTHRQARLVDAPVVAAAPLIFECKWLKTVLIPKRKGDEGDNFVVIGEVVGTQVCTSIITNGVVDVAKLRPVARLGYSQEYTVISDMLAIGETRR